MCLAAKADLFKQQQKRNLLASDKQTNKKLFHRRNVGYPAACSSVPESMQFLIPAAATRLLPTLQACLVSVCPMICQVQCTA